MQITREISVPDRAQNLDLMYLALASIKEVKDVLRGHLQPDLGGYGGKEDRPW
jgi:hypothetical protein